MTVCAIHQPNFFPWLGYFDKIRRADVFVFLDRVHYPKSGNSMGSWCNRVKVDVSGLAKWIHCPVVREHGPQWIDEVRIDDSRPWRDDLRKTLEINYKKAPHFEQAFASIDALLAHQTDSLADFNVNAVEALAVHTGARATFVRQSAMTLPAAAATERLIAICRAVGADTYLCGGGAEGYQEDAAFAAAGIGLEFQHFTPQPYRPMERFIPGLSVIDWMMHAAAPCVE